MLILCVALSGRLFAQRIPVLNQIDLPHDYYYRELYLPQLTSGPSAVAWFPDGKKLIYSMQGTLWTQAIDQTKAIQLTDDAGYDYQPDVSPDGNKIVFVRYNGTAVELMLIDLQSGQTIPLTNNKAVNLEPRWAPDGKSIAFVSTADSGHFLLYTARLENKALGEFNCLSPDHKSTTKRYYYSAFDHAINPSWSPDGKKIIFVSNREIAHGTGDIVSINLQTKEIHAIHHEETSWRTKPEISPDGTRMVYASYLGRNWHQLWMLPSGGGYPLPITYGEFDNTAPRWSPDGKQIAFISNRSGNTSLWLVNVFDGGQQQVIAGELRYLKQRKLLDLVVQNENRDVVPARISITDGREVFYAPRNAWIHGDDSRYPGKRQFESHYFHSNGKDTIHVPVDKITLRISHGPQYEILTTEIDANKQIDNPLVITLRRLPVPADFGHWQSGDLHVHMNYGGHYRDTPKKLIAQAEAEDLNYVFNLIVNKEQRVPDVMYFSNAPDKASTPNAMLLHSQEFHTSFWGHLGLLGLNDHLIVPGYSGYPQTAVESLFPHNGFVADRAHAQHALVGYVHPYEKSSIFPEQSGTLFHELPVDAPLGKVDYYELLGFADHKASEAVWYQLLNCGLRIPAGAGTDAMANYASLRGPLGTDRVYVKAEGPLDHQNFLTNVAQGKSFVTNGPLVSFTVDGKTAGDSIAVGTKSQKLSYRATLNSQVPIDHFEIVWNGAVVAEHKLTGSRQQADVTGTIKVSGSGWVLLRAWNEEAHPDILDLYPMASTNPVYVNGPRPIPEQKTAANYFLKWVTRIENHVGGLPFRNESEKQIVVDDIRKAKQFYENRSK